jgi:hypothetical protein
MGKLKLRLKVLLSYLIYYRKVESFQFLKEKEITIFFIILLKE